MQLTFDHGAAVDYTLHRLGFTGDKRQLMRTILYVLAFAAIAVLLLGASGAFAADASMPWESPICRVAESLRGTTAKALSVIAIVICGCMMAFGELGGVFKTVLGLLMGVCMAVLGSKWLFTLTDVTYSCQLT